MMNGHRTRRFRGFTLVELLLVIAVVAILAALVVPGTRRMIASSRSSACLSNLRSIGVGLNLHLADNNMMMPELRAMRETKTEEVPVIDNTLDRYLSDPAVFACPADGKGFAAATGTSYYWNTALNGQAVANLNFLAVIEDRSRIPIIADKEGFHEYFDQKVNILFADGHATKELQFFTSK